MSLTHLRAKDGLQPRSGAQCAAQTIPCALQNFAGLCCSAVRLSGQDFRDLFSVLATAFSKSYGVLPWPFLWRPT